MVQARVRATIAKRGRLNWFWLVRSLDIWADCARGERLDWAAKLLLLPPSSQLLYSAITSCIADIGLRLQCDIMHVRNSYSQPIKRTFSKRTSQIARI